MIVDALPELKQDKPRGYQHGGGYDNVPGLYSSGSKRMVVAERASYKNSPPHLNRSVAGTMFHELGHAYDDARGSPSEHGAFATAYEQDSYKLTNSMRSKHAYYTQPGHAGPSELFAEMFAIVNQENSGQPPRNPHLVQAFPNSYKAMKDLLPTK